MASSDFDKERIFSTALTDASEKRFNVSRFAGIVFGFQASSGAHAARIFHPMAPGAAAFSADLPQGFSCGGTPTDEALFYFYQELNRTRIPNRMQVAVLVTDGIPTLCYTTGSSCSGQINTGNTAVASDAAIAERFRTGKLSALGSLIITVGIGSDLNVLTGATQRYGAISGTNLLRNFASAPQFAFLATDFAVLVNETLKQVLDLLCFYTIQIVTPEFECATSGTMFVIKGYNVFSMGTPKCRWQEVGTSNYFYTDAFINATNEVFSNEPGTVGLVNCPAPMLTKDLNVYLEVSREGTYYTNNQISVLLRKDCSILLTPECPNSTIINVLRVCTPADLTSGCSAVCTSATEFLARDFKAMGPYAAFSDQQIKACIAAIQTTTFTPAQKDQIAAAKGNPCANPTGATNTAWTPVTSLFGLVVGVLLL
jgi:hypothetical protein